MKPFGTRKSLKQLSDPRNRQPWRVGLPRRDLSELRSLLLQLHGPFGTKLSLALQTASPQQLPDRSADLIPHRPGSNPDQRPLCQPGPHLGRVGVDLHLGTSSPPKLLTLCWTMAVKALCCGLEA